MGDDGSEFTGVAGLEQGIGTVQLRLKDLAESVGAVIGTIDAKQTALASGLDGLAKAVVAASLHQRALEVARGLAAAAGVDGPVAPDPLVGAAVQAGATTAARHAILDLIGPQGLRAHAAAAVRAKVGGGPVQRARMLLEGGLGVGRRHARRHDAPVERRQGDRGLPPPVQQGERQRL